MTSTFDAVVGNALRVRLNVPDMHEDTAAELARVERIISRQQNYFQLGAKTDVETHEFLFVDIEKQVTHTTLRYVVRSTVKSKLHSKDPTNFAFTFIRSGMDVEHPLTLLAVDYVNDSGEGISHREYNATRLRPVDIKDFAGTTAYIRQSGLCVRCLEDWSDGEGEGEVTQWVQEDRPGISVSIFTISFDNETFEVEVKKVWGGVPQVVNVIRHMDM